MNVCVFDLETVPDVVLARKVLGLDALTDEEVLEALFTTRRNEGHSEFLPLHYHKIVAISLVMRSHDGFKIWSLGEHDSIEKELITRFFAGIEKFVPTLVSWNGTNFDLPVLHYRALLHSVVFPTYWETGETDQAFKWNNYLSRYHTRHTDLMEVLSAYQGRAFAGLNDIALLLNLPGKLGMDGKSVHNEYLAGNIVKIRNYCETDVLNTYLVYLRFEYIRGKLSLDKYQQEELLVKEYLKASSLPHLQEFLAVWTQNRA